MLVDGRRKKKENDGLVGVLFVLSLLGVINLVSSLNNAKFHPFYMHDCCWLVVLHTTFSSMI